MTITPAQATQTSGLEAIFALAMKHVGCEMVPQYRFDSTRRWAFDLADPQTKVAVEIDGGEFSRGAHTRGKRIAADCEKRNEARLRGWIVFVLTGAQVRKAPMQWAEKIARFVREKERQMNVIDALVGILEAYDVEIADDRITIDELRRGVIYCSAMEDDDGKP